jgi:hypothetical protein
MGTNKKDWELDEKTGLMMYKPRISAARRRQMAAEDAALARERAALAHRANFRVVGGTDHEGRPA